MLPDGLLQHAGPRPEGVLGRRHGDRRKSRRDVRPPARLGRLRAPAGAVPRAVQVQHVGRAPAPRVRAVERDGRMQQRSARHDACGPLVQDDGAGRALEDVVVYSPHADAVGRVAQGVAPAEPPRHERDPRLAHRVLARHALGDQDVDRSVDVGRGGIEPGRIAAVKAAARARVARVARVGGGCDEGQRCRRCGVPLRARTAVPCETPRNLPRGSEHPLGLGRRAHRYLVHGSVGRSEGEGLRRLLPCHAAKAGCPAY